MEEDFLSDPSDTKTNLLLAQGNGRNSGLVRRGRGQSCWCPTCRPVVLAFLHVLATLTTAQQSFSHHRTVLDLLLGEAGSVGTRRLQGHPPLNGSWESEANALPGISSHVDHLYLSPSASRAAQHKHRPSYLFLSFPRTFHSFSSFPR